MYLYRFLCPLGMDPLPHRFTQYRFYIIFKMRRPLPALLLPLVHPLKSEVRMTTDVYTLRFPVKPAHVYPNVHMEIHAHIHS